MIITCVAMHDNRVVLGSTRISFECFSFLVGTDTVFTYPPSCLHLILPLPPIFCTYSVSFSTAHSFSSYMMSPPIPPPLVSSISSSFHPLPLVYTPLPLSSVSFNLDLHSPYNLFLLGSPVTTRIGCAHFLPELA